MLIFFEGVDKSGKSTQIDLLLQHTSQYKKYRSTHQRNKKIDLEEAIKHDWRFFLDITSQINLDIVFDRCFISQFVYSKVFRHENIINHFNNYLNYYNLFKEYCKILSKIPHKIFYCIRQNYEGVEDDFTNLEFQENLKKEFNLFFSLYKKYINIIPLYFENGIENNFQIILKELSV